MENKIKYKHLRCFMEVVRLQNLSRAAEALNLAQPAMSRYLSELESSVGAPLLIRGRNGCRLTPMGNRFYQNVAPGVELIKNAYSMVGPEGDRKEVITVGVLPTVAADFLPRIVDRLKREQFRPAIRVIEGSNAEMLGLLRRCEVALVLGRLGTADLMQGLSFEHLYSEPIECFARPGHPITEQSTIVTRDVCHWPVILNLPGTVIRAEVDSHLYRRGVSLPADTVEAHSISFTRRLTLMDDRIWIIARGVVQQDLEDGILERLPVSDWEINGSVGMTTNPNYHLSDSVRHVIELVRAEAEATLARNRR